MDIHQNIHFKLYRFFLTMFGFWPYQSKLSKKIIVTVFSISTLSLLIAYSFRMGKEKDISNKIILENITASCFLLSALIQNWIIQCNDSKIKVLYEKFMMDWQQTECKEEEKLLTSYTRKGMLEASKLAIYSAPAYIIILFLTVGLPFLISIDPESVIFPYYCKSMIISDKWRFHQTFIHSLISVLYVCMHYYITCATCVICSNHVCGIFAIARYRLQNSTQGKPTEDEIYSKLIGVVRKHNEAIHEIHLMEEVYSKPFLLKQTLSFSLVGILMSIIFSNPGNFSDFSASFCAVFTFILHAYYSNQSGQQILTTSCDIGKDVYMLEWHTMSVKIRKLLIFIMTRSSKPEKLTAGSIWAISLENLKLALQGSWSFAAVVSTLGFRGQSNCD